MLNQTQFLIPEILRWVIRLDFEKNVTLPSSAQSLNGYSVGHFGHLLTLNRPRSIYQYSSMAPRLSRQTSIFGVVFFVSKSLLGMERQKKLEKFAILTRKPRCHA